jgi:hypothetical protein
LVAAEGVGFRARLAVAKSCAEREDELRWLMMVPSVAAM